MNLSEIKSILENSPSEEFLQSLATDERSGVKKLLATWQKKQQLQEQEIVRLTGLYKYERELSQAGCRYVAGVDEAGRGPLAGPLVVAAVILQENHFLLGLNDSKQVSAARREQLFEQIGKEAIAVKIQIIPVEVIDSLNIYQATVQGMKDALLSLSVQPEHALIDAVPLTDFPFSTISLVHGDSISASIAAASIMAKVTRDRIMQELEQEYPGYGFARHKGYGTKEHMDALLAKGPTAQHRRSFEPVKSLVSRGGRFEYTGNNPANK